MANQLASARDVSNVGSIPGLGRSVWQPSPVFLPGESHEQRSLVGYSPWCLEELDTTEVTACSIQQENTNITKKGVI